MKSNLKVDGSSRDRKRAPGSTEMLILCLCARASLPGESARKLQELTRTSLDWKWILHVAKRHRLVPLLRRNLGASCPHAVPVDVMAALLEGSQNIAIQSLVMSADLVELLRSFERAGIAVISYKGPVLAELAYGDLALREFDDLDILVREMDVERAKALLMANGFRSRANENLGAFFVENSCHFLFIHSQHGYLLELHWKLTPSYFPLAIKQRELWQHVRHIQFGGTKILGHQLEYLILLLCIHGSKHHWSRLAWIADLAEIIRKHPGLQWLWLLAEARRLRCKRMLLLGIWLAVTVLDAPIPECARNALIEDPLVRALGAEVCEGISQKDEIPWAGVKNVFFLCRVRECMRDRVAYVVRRALTPTEQEWLWQEIAGPLQILYFPLRGYRLTVEHGSRMLYRALGVKRR